jgi:hypothetical protein
VAVKGLNFEYKIFSPYGTGAEFLDSGKYLGFRDMNQEVQPSIL